MRVFLLEPARARLEVEADTRPVQLRSDGHVLRLLLCGVRVTARAVQELDRAGDHLHSTALGAVRRLPIAGGLPVLDGGTVAGAIGVAGAMTGAEDRQIAEAALEQAFAPTTASASPDAELGEQ